MGLKKQNSIGPSILRSSVIEGRFLEDGKPEALVEQAYARQFGIKLNDTISVADKKFPVVGFVDASRAAKIAVANVYLPLKEAEDLAISSKELQSVSPYKAGDVNLLFVKADQEKITGLASEMKGILGNKATVATPDSFLKLLGSLFALSDKFTLAASLIAIIVAVLIAFKTMAGNIAERAREIGVLKAVGLDQSKRGLSTDVRVGHPMFYGRYPGSSDSPCGRIRFKFHEGQYSYPLGDEPDAALSSRRGRPDF